MYHSIFFGGKNTWDDWHIVPSSRPLFNPPEPKTEYVDIPGADGSLDYTETLAGIKYKNREGSWEFIVMNEYEDWAVKYTTIMAFLQGKKMRVVLEDDPLYFYNARLKVNEWRSEKDYSRIVIDYVAEPYKYPINTTASYDWLWADLFYNIIYYGTFDVNETKERNLINPTGAAVSPVFTCSTAMVVTFGSNTYNLPAGTTSDSGISLASGNNVMTFAGNGRVVVDYSTGKTL